MKRINLALVLATCLLFFSCQKNAHDQLINPSEEIASATQQDDAKISGWYAIDLWNEKQSIEEGDLYEGIINDAAITNGVLENGLVLVFTKVGTNTAIMPFNQLGYTAINWIYQTVPGQIVVSGTAGKDHSINKKQEFSYMILSHKKVAKLEEAGISRNILMNMDFDKAVSLIK